MIKHDFKFNKNCKKITKCDFGYGTLEYCAFNDGRNVRLAFNNCNYRPVGEDRYDSKMDEIKNSAELVFEFHNRAGVDTLIKKLNDIKPLLPYEPQKKAMG